MLLTLRQFGWLDAETGAFTAIDGDSLRKDATEYRLNGIDAPELQQTCEGASGGNYTCGHEAREALRALVRGKDLTCISLEIDRYGRDIVVCNTGGADINGEMVRQGWAIAYRRHSLAYVGDEADAQRAKRGIWRGRFEDPEAWRERHRGSVIKGGLDGGDVPLD